MSRIGNAFKNGKAFIPFVTGGDPSLDVTEQLIYAMTEAGADLIEIGVPFSDPVAEGVVIQDANERALAAGCTTDKLFDLVAKVRKTVEIPIVFLTYVNPIYTYGKEAFLKKCRECGLDGLIVPDLPYEEKGEILPECEKYGVDLISLVAPTSHERVKLIAREAQGFLPRCYRRKKRDPHGYWRDGEPGKVGFRRALRGRIWNFHPGTGKENGGSFRWSHCGKRYCEDRG